MLTKNTIHKIINRLRDLDNWELQAVESADPPASTEAIKARRSLARLIRQLKDEIGEAPPIGDDIPFDDIECLLNNYETLWYWASGNDDEYPSVIPIVRQWLDRATIPF